LKRPEDAPFPAKLRDPTRTMFEFIGPEMDWTKKLGVANLWLFEPLVVSQLARSPLTHATRCATLVATIVNAGIKDNVRLAQARAVITLRIIPG